MDEERIRQARCQAEICGLFGNPNRILILWAIGTEELSVSEIAAMIGASLQNTSQHLRLMRDKGMLTSRRKGNAVFYRMQPHELLESCHVVDLATSSSESS